MKKNKKAKIITIAFVASLLFGLMGITNYIYASSPSIKIISPVSGEAWRIGETHTIKWKSSNLSENGIKELGIFIQNDNVGGSGNSMYITPNGERISASKNSYTWKIESTQILLNDGSKDMKKFDIIIYGYDEQGNQKMEAEIKGRFTILPEKEVSNGKISVSQCANVQRKLNEKYTYFYDKGQGHMTVYTNLVDRVNKFIAKFDEANLDTSSVKNHVIDLQNKIAKFKKDSDLYQASLIATIETIGNGCSDPGGKFKSKLLETKELLKNVHTDAMEIRTYVREVIIKDINNLKTQLY